MIRRRTVFRYHWAESFRVPKYRRGEKVEKRHPDPQGIV